MSRLRPSNQMVSWFQAKSILGAQGYSTLVLARNNPFNLIAWKKGRNDLKFIRVVSTRSRSPKLTDDTIVHALVDISKTGTYPGEIQLWVKSRNQWMRYIMCPSGVLPHPFPEAV